MTSQSPIGRLSPESARQHYEKLYDYHNDNRDLVKRVRDFWHDLEHYILKEITKRNKFYDEYDDINKPRWKRKILEKGQLSWLKENNIQISLVSNIQNFKPHRNDAEHLNTMDIITYYHLFQTMVRTIHYFSSEPIPEKIENILNIQKQKDIPNIIVEKETIKEQTISSIIFERIKKPIDEGLKITGQTTPVVYFGNYALAQACTISINPSDKEFLNEKNNILIGDDERLCSRKKLIKEDTDTLLKENVEEVLKYCDNYFNNNPYKQWFNKIECMINKFGYSYGYSYDGKNDNSEKKCCVHLNLVQWATTPFWSKIKNKEIKKEHIINDIYILEYLLKSKIFEKIFINGTTVANVIEEYLSIELKKIDMNFTNKNKKIINYTLYTGNYNGIEVTGWSTPVQSPAIGGYENIDLLYKSIESK